jgi:SecA-like ATPase subunit of protein translocation complex
VQIPNRQHCVQSTIGWRQRLARLQGSPVAFDLRAYDQELAEINRLGMDVEQYSDGEIAARARELRERAGGSLESIRAAFLAVAHDASRRVLGLRPFDVQVLAAIALDCGHIVEMQTGEGKTLAAVEPVVRQKSVRTSLAPLAVTRIDRPRAFSTRTRSDFARGTSEQTQLTPGAASIAAGVTSSAYAA